VDLSSQDYGLPHRRINGWVRNLGLYCIESAGELVDFFTFSKKSSHTAFYRRASIAQPCVWGWFDFKPPKKNKKTKNKKKTPFS
jgi:hypothetical protein